MRYAGPGLEFCFFLARYAGQGMNLARYAGLPASPAYYTQDKEIIQCLRPKVTLTDLGKDSKTSVG